MSAAVETGETTRGSRTLLVLMLLAGAAAFLYGAAVSPARAWGMYLVNLLFFSSLAITGPALAGMMQLTEARWSPAIKRLAVTTAGFLPFSLALFIGLYFGRAELYPWVTNPALAAKKAEWLNVPFMAARILGGVFLLYWVALTFTRAVIVEPADGGGAAGQARRNRLAGTLLILYVIVLSLWGFDLLMTLDPVWYSGLFGGYYVVTSLYTGFGLVTFLAARAAMRGTAAVEPRAVQDIAKLVFAMCVMWMYFFFSQYLVIWYGNVPIETRFFLRRFFDDPWRTMAFVILIVGWFLPFSYLLKRLTGRPPERHLPLVVVVFMGWVAIFLERVLLVFPALTRDNVFPLGPVEILISLGFLALFILSRQRFLARHRV
jgi:hypothetical protein